jgi:MtaA/CmuA family methyltransferase
MNSYENYMTTLNGGKPEVTPRVPILMSFAAHHIGSNYGAFVSDWRVLVEANLRCASDFGFDQVSAISDPYREAEGFGAVVRVDESGPKCEQLPLADGLDLGRLAIPDPFSGRMLDRIRAVEAFKKEAYHKLSILGWVEGPAAEAADLRGVESFLMDLMDEEPAIPELMDLCTENAIRFAIAQIEAGADTVGVGEALCSQIPPAIYEELILPREKRLVDAIHAAGARVRLHICGNTTHLLPGIATLGVDILDVDYMVSLAKVREVLGPKVAPMGNLDPVSAVMRSTPAEIRAAVEASRKAAGWPFLIGAGCEIPLGTPSENLAALCSPLAP